MRANKPSETARPRRAPVRRRVECQTGCTPTSWRITSESMSRLAPPTKKRVADIEGRGQAARAPRKNPRAMPAHRLQRGMGTPLKTSVRSGMRWHTGRNILSKKYPSGPRGKVALAMGRSQGKTPANPKLPRARTSGQWGLTAGGTSFFYTAMTVLPRSN